MKRYRYYVTPPRDVFSSMEGDDYAAGFRTYAEYNYLRSGVAAAIKTRHFEAALELTKDHFHRCNVIDLGCADGVFLPSLSRHFDHVLAVDRFPMFLKVAAQLVKKLRLDNVEVRPNEAARSHDVKVPRLEKRYHIAYLLEVLEHIGSRTDLYGAKIGFLKQAASLLDDDGFMVISVPIMVGIPFLLQRIGLAAFGLLREKISLKDLLKAGLFRNTEDLEKNWRGEDSHLGFNHKKLERYLKRDFRIVKKKNLFFQMLYLIKK